MIRRRVPQRREGDPRVLFDTPAQHKVRSVGGDQRSRGAYALLASATRAGQLFREPNRGLHTGRAGLVLAGDVVSRAVVG